MSKEERVRKAHQAIHDRHAEIAVELLKPLLDTGDRTAQAWMGYLYVTGDGVSQNIGLGQRLLGESAFAGDADGQALYAGWVSGLQHKNGPEAAEWSCKAVTQMNAQGAANLSELSAPSSSGLLSSVALVTDPVLAYAWWSVAKNLDYEQFMYLDGDGQRLSAKLSASQKLQAQELAAKWSPQNQLPPCTSGVTFDARQRNDIDHQIEFIRQTGRFMPLPSATSEPGLAHAPEQIRYLVTNETSYPLHLFMSGPVRRSITVRPQETSSITIAPGLYKIAGRLDTAGVLPFYGEQTFGNSAEYSTRFSK